MLWRHLELFARNNGEECLKVCEATGRRPPAGWGGGRIHSCLTDVRGGGAYQPCE